MVSFASGTICTLVWCRVAWGRPCVGSVLLVVWRCGGCDGWRCGWNCDRVSVSSRWCRCRWGPCLDVCFREEGRDVHGSFSHVVCRSKGRRCATAAGRKWAEVVVVRQGNPRARSRGSSGDHSWVQLFWLSNVFVVCGSGCWEGVRNRKRRRRWWWCVCARACPSKRRDATNFKKTHVASAATLLVHSRTGCLGGDNQTRCGTSLVSPYLLAWGAKSPWAGKWILGTGPAPAFP